MASPDLPDRPEPDPQRDGARRWQLVALVLAILLAAATGALIYGSLQEDDTSRIVPDAMETDTETDGSTQAPEQPSGTTPPEDADDAGGGTADETPSPTVLDCPDFGMTGIEGESGAGFFDISTRNLSCDEAKQLMLAISRDDWTRSIDGYTCTVLEELQEGERWRCEQGDQAFRFSVGA